MKETITVCDELIDKVIPYNIDQALFDLCEAGKVCGRSVCGGGTRPRLVFRTADQRNNFMQAAAELGQTSPLRSWLTNTNPRLAVYVSGRGTSSVPSVDFLEALKL